MEKILQIQLFAQEMELVFLLILALVTLDTQETIVNYQFALEKILQIQLFVPEMELVCLQILVIAIQDTWEIIVN
jgi:hypothetical protein